MVTAKKAVWKRTTALVVQVEMGRELVKRGRGGVTTSKGGMTRV